MSERSVLHLSPSSAWGGAEAMALLLRDECARAGWRTRLDLPIAVPDGWHRAGAQPVSWRRWALSPRELADVVHAHLPWPDRLGVALIAARTRPLVVTFQLLPQHDWPRDRCTLLPCAWMLRAAARRPRTRWVALSRADARILEAMLGVTVTVVRNAPPAPSAAPAPLSWPEGVCRVLSVGRLVDQKGFDRALRALASPAVRALPWHWNIVGEGEARDTLTMLAATLGLASRVSFVGARPAVDGLCNADLVLAPSRFEGMPLVPLEAAEAGVMVLASRIAAHEELYEQAPESLLDADEGRWPTTLLRFLGDPALRARVLLAQRSVLGDNPRRVTYAAYEALYRELLKRS